MVQELGNLCTNCIKLSTTRSGYEKNSYLVFIVAYKSFQCMFPGVFVIYQLGNLFFILVLGNFVL